MIEFSPNVMRNDQNKHKNRIGGILLDYGLITSDQLTRALDRQVGSGRRLGSILEDMGFLDTETLLSVLSKQQDTPYINLFELQVPPEVLKIIPFEQVRSLKVLPINKSSDSLSLAMVDPGDFNAIENVESAAGSKVKPFIVPHYQMDKAIAAFENEGYGNAMFTGERIREEKGLVELQIPTIYTLLKLLGDFRATDLHLSAGASPSMRINNNLKRLSMPVITAAQMKNFAADIMTHDQMIEFEKYNELDFVLPLSDTGRFRINAYKQRNSITISARLIFEQIPSPEELSLPEWMTGYALKPHGLMLITGLPGHGKTTTMSALVDIINANRKCNIVMIEDPIEFLHKHKMSNVNQREVGIDTETFASGLKHIVRQDPDVIVIGELRDPESMAIALNASEAGCLVICIMHSSNTITAIDRILNTFPEHQVPQIRMQLADSLLLALSQKLLPKLDSEGRIPAFEKLTNSTRVGNLIREGKIFNLKTLMQGISDDMSSIDRSIARLCFDGKISFEDGLKYSDNSAYYQELVRTGRL